VRGPANRIEVEHMVSTLIGNRIVQEDALSGRDVENDPIVRFLKEGHGRGVLLVPRSLWTVGTLGGIQES